MKRILGIFIILSMCSCAVYKKNPLDATEKVLVGGLGITAIGDIYTTKKGLDAGAVEQNKLMGKKPGVGKMVAGKMAAGGTLIGALGYLNHFWRKALLSLGIGVNTYAIIHNSKVLKKIKKKESKNE